MKLLVFPVSAACLMLSVANTWAAIPDPTQCRCPDWIVIVGKINGGSTPDPVGRSTFLVKDFNANPIAGALVTADLSACCDITLCEATANGVPASVNGNRVTGFTNPQGQVDFIFMGAARDPGTETPPEAYGGCGLASARPTMEADFGIVIQCDNSTTIVSLDLNGAAGQSNGTTVSDVGNLLNLFGAIALGAPYRARGDVDQSGAVTISDVSTILGHLGRLSLNGGVGCTAPYTPGPGCP